ncbi:hypothetical protein VP01_29g5 [Puccinia sorghi]|uniref:Crossover junction endonuclease MUS81 n=1 Tax=Puccinia sorghi TaxID=27349 RepID=A0A0L6V255_9BASI|nr:hypothetical protein VP01_29g5 [Puccinia sorghi]
MPVPSRVISGRGAGSPKDGPNAPGPRPIRDHPSGSTSSAVTMAPATMPNVEWAGWVLEAADHAANNGSRSCDTYRRAARAIRAHNQAFQHPRQALVLSGVGEGVVRLITARLQEKCNATGDPFPAEPPNLKRKRNGPNQTRPRKRPEDMLTADERALDSCSSDDQNQPPPSQSFNSNAVSASQTKNKTQQRKSNAPTAAERALTAEERALDDPSSSTDSDEPTNAPKTQRQSRATRKKYVPKRRTGCYGILIAMSILTSERAGPFTKSEIIQHAQEYCDSSYTERASRGGGAGNSGHYTAWNMKKLLTEGLSESKAGRPAKFTLTQQGFEVGSILAEQEGLSLLPFDKSTLPAGAECSLIDSTHSELNISGDSLPKASSSKSTDYSKKALDKSNSNDSNLSNIVIQQTINPQRSGFPNRGLFEFWYLDRAGSRVRNMDDADTRMHPRTFETLYQVEFAKSQISHPVKRSSIADEAPLCPTTMSDSDSHMIGWMYESKAIPNCPGFGLSTRSPTMSTSAIADQSSSIITSTNKNTSPKAPSPSLSNKHPRLPSSRPHHPPINVTREDSHCGASSQTTAAAGYLTMISPPDHLFKPTSSGSATPVGSVISIHSDVDSASEDPLPLEHLKPPSRVGSCEIMLSGTALSQTVFGWSASNSLDNNGFTVSEPVSSRPSGCTLGVNLRRTCSLASGRQSDPTSAVDLLLNARASVSLQRTPSTLSESHSRRASADGLPNSRTVVSLKRTSSTLSESHISRTSPNVDLEPEVWKAGSYDICLVLDHREVRAVNDRDAFYNYCVNKAAELSESHSSPIRVLQRALVLGDAIWIAVHHNDDKREVVLDSIVERKRLDDLCSSIKDNRFEEQKARLKRSGLRDPIYLVEDYNTQSNLESHGQMIYTSKFETMLLNDFQLETTPDWKASVEFLMRRTEVLRDLHKTIDLSIIPDSEIDLTTYLPKLTDLRRKEGGRYWVTSYGSFEDLNGKSTTLTVRQLWARMVSCLPGMSATKATTIMDHWPTPSQFWADVNSHASLDPSAGPSSDKHPWSWIERIANSPLPSSHLPSDHSVTPCTPQGSDSGGSATASASNATNARIGPTLSKRLWDLYTLSDYDSSSS